MQCHSVEPTGRRYLSVKPILFMSQRAPGSFHSFVPPIRRLIACALRELRAMLGVFAENFRLLHAILPQGKLRACFNPRLIRRVPSKRWAILQKVFSSMHGDEQPFRNRPPLQLEVGRASQRREGGLKAPEVSITTSVANDGAAIPTDGRRTADHRRSRRLRNSSVATSIGPTDCKPSVPGRCSTRGSPGEVHLASPTPNQT